MELRLMTDKALFLTAMLLLMFGVVMVYSASSVLAAEKFGNQWYFLARQALWVVIGLAVMLAAINIDYHFYQKSWVVYLMLLVCLALLVAVFFAPAINGAHRWLRWGSSVSFQPSEMAKLSLTIFLASYLSKRFPGGIENYWKTFFPCAIVAGAVMGLIAQEPDLGMAIAIGGILMVFLFVVGVPIKHQLTLAVAAFPALYHFLFGVGWRTDRLLVFLDPWRDPQGRGFQPIQSMIAIGSGGLLGTGLAQGKQKLFYLPEPHTDFIFAEIGEELGLIGVFLVIIAFGVLFWRGMRLALRAPDTFGMLLGTGITVSILGQALWNMSVTLGLLPVKGMPLPLISYGGTSLVLTLAQIGILLNIAGNAER
jgi:cell division protein FtsW